MNEITKNKNSLHDEVRYYWVTECLALVEIN